MIPLLRLARSVAALLMVPLLATTLRAEGEGHAPEPDVKRDYPRPVSLSRNGRFVATSERDWTVRVWDAVEGRLLHEFPGERYGGHFLSPDGRLLLTSGGPFTGEKLTLRDTASGKFAWERPSRGATAAYFAADGKTLLTITALPTRIPKSYLETVDVASGRTSKFLGGVQDFFVFALSPDAGVIALVDREAEKPVVRLYNVQSGEELALLRPEAPARLAVAPEGKRVVVAGGDGHLALWNGVTGQVERSLSGPPSGRRFEIPDLLFSPDGRSLATSPRAYGRAPESGGLQLWDPDTGQPAALLPEATGMLLPVFSPDGTLIAARTVDHRLRVWKTGTGALLHTFAAPPAGLTYFSSRQDPMHAFAADGKTLVATGEAEVRRWNLATGKLEHSFRLEERE